MRTTAGFLFAERSLYDDKRDEMINSIRRDMKKRLHHHYLEFARGILESRENSQQARQLRQENQRRHNKFMSR